MHFSNSAFAKWQNSNEQSNLIKKTSGSPKQSQMLVLLEIQLLN